MVGYNPRCKLCNCERRAEAEKMHEDGASLKQIVDFLGDHGLTLSKPAVKRHFDTHFAPKDEAAERYFKESEAVMHEAVEKRLTDLQMLDAVIERNYRLHALAADNAESSLTTDRPVILRNGKPLLDPDNDYKPIKSKLPPAKPVVDLVTGAASELRQAIKLKAELLGDLQPEGTTNIDLSGLSMEELRSLANLDAGAKEDSS